MDHLIEVEVSVGAIRHNTRFFRELAPESLFMAVLKSHAYGHSIPFAVEALQGLADWFGVNSLQEAVQIRRLDSVTPVLIMGALEPGFEAEETLRNLIGGTAVVSGLPEIQRLERCCPALPFHLKVDTGMSRLGFRGEALEEVFRYLEDRPELPWSGLMTHFADVEDVTEQDFARLQLERFLEARERAYRAARGRTLLCHAAASAAAMLLPESRLDLIRVGISLYGLWPSTATRISLHHLLGRAPELRPVLRWRARIVHITDVEPGSTVGYGRTWKVQDRTRVGVIPVGYNEGYPRVLSNRAHVLVRGRRCRVLGRVCMNMIMVDLTGLPGVEPGEPATLLGRDLQEEVSAEELADLSHTINYEIVTRIHPDLPRKVFAGEGDRELAPELQNGPVGPVDGVSTGGNA